MALCSKSTPREYLHYLKERHIDHIIAGEDLVDLKAALLELNDRYKVKVVRVDAGGTLNGILLCHGLVAEVSVLVYPSMTTGKRGIFRALELPNTKDGSKNAISLDLMRAKQLKVSAVWLRYKVKSTADPQIMGLAGFEPAATRL